jgi:hypothetical protein
MKYRKKVQHIDAVPFEWGMEDGIIQYNSYIPKDCSAYHPDLNSTKYPGYYAKYDKELDERGFDQSQGYVPYITTRSSLVAVIEGDYVITDELGNRYPYSADMLALHFEPVVDCEEVNQ